MIIDNVRLYRPYIDDGNQIYHIHVENGVFKAIRKGRTTESGDRVYNGQGRTLMASFNDSHIHYLRLGIMKSELDLREAKTWQQFQEAVHNHYKDIMHHDWIVGNGMLDNEFTDIDHLLTADDIDKLGFQKPAFFLHDDMHECVVNHIALDMIKDDKALHEHHDVFIEKDEEGNWTGRFKDTAVHHIKYYFRDRSVSEVMDDLRGGFDDLLSHGITSIQTDDLTFVGSYDRLWQAYRTLEDNGELPVKAYLHHYVFHKYALDYFLNSTSLRTGQGSDRVKVGAVKLFLDGTQRLRTAAMGHPYPTNEDTRGVLLYTDDELREIVNLADDNDMQLTMHAIGDRAVEQAVGVLQGVGVKRMRHRIIHIQTLRPDLVQSLKELKPYVETQPVFLMKEYDKKADWVPNSLVPYSDAWGTVMREGIPFTSSSDAPISPISPHLGIFAAVNRTDEHHNPAGGWMPQEKLPLDDAYRSYTETPAFLEFQEREKGKIEEGYAADFILLDKHPKEVPSKSIKDIQVCETWIDGSRVYRAE